MQKKNGSIKKKIRLSSIETISFPFSFGHDRKPTRPGLKITSPPLLMRRRPDQRRQRSLHQIPLHGPNPYQRIRHRRSPRIKPVRMIRHRTILVIPIATTPVHVLVETTPERSRVCRRRAHARLFLAGERLVVLLLVYGDRTAGRGWALVDWESDGRRGRWGGFGLSV